MDVTESKILNQQLSRGSLHKPIVNPYSINVNNDNYVRGDVNPLKRETTKNILTINSKYRNNNKDSVITPESKTKYINNVRPITTDFTIELNNTYNNVVSIKLASAELMNSYYPFSEYLNTIRFNITTYLFDANDVSSNNYSDEIVIPEGVYTATTIISEINTIFAANTSLSFVEVSFVLRTGKIIFKIKPQPPLPPPPDCSYGFNLDFSVSSDPYRDLFLNMGWMLGFRKQKYNFFKDYNRSSVLNPGYNSEAPADFTGTKFFLLEIEDYNKNNPEVFNYNLDSRSSFNINNIIAKIPNTSESFHIIFEDSSDRVFKTRKYFGPVKISKLHIKLLDDNGKIINLNNSDIIISLEIETLEVPYKNMVY